MKNLTIFRKLLVSFGAVLIMTLALGFTAIGAINNMDTMIDKYANVTIPAIEELWKARRAVQAIEKRALETTIVMNEAELKEVETVLLNERNNLDTALANFLALEPQFESEVKHVQNLLTDISSVRARIMSEAEKFTEEGNEAAYRIYHDEYVVQYSEIINELSSLTTQLEELVAERDRNGDATKAISAGITYAVLAICLVVIVIFTKLLSDAVVKPVTELENAAILLSQGKLSEANVSYTSKDEVGILADSVRGLVNNLETVIGDIDYMLTSMAKGDFTTTSKAQEAYVGELQHLYESMMKVQSHQRGALKQLKVSADHVFSGSDQVAAGSQSLAQGSTEQAAAIQELAATLNDISTEVKATAENALQAKEMSEKSGIETNECNNQMHEMINAMNDINDKSNEISKIIKAIEDIAFQTNILALNAAVEAARAGAAGKGFAVVADEVRNLAAKSAEASQSTAQLIEDTVSAINRGSKIAHYTADSLTKVVEDSQAVGVLVEKIADAANTQATAISQITIGIDDISGVIQTNSATAEESAATAEELSAQATTLQHMVRYFKIDAE